MSKALEQHLANYRGHDFQVIEIFLDSESGLIALNEIYQLRGVKLTYASPGQHIPVIRLVKERLEPAAISTQNGNLGGYLFGHRGWHMGFLIGNKLETDWRRIGKQIGDGLANRLGNRLGKQIGKRIGKRIGKQIGKTDWQTNWKTDW